MYSPTHYQTEDQALIRRIVAENQFAVLITGEAISHLPLLLDRTSNGERLIGHMARANSQWRGFPEIKTALAIFQGPHAYISPAWYIPKDDNVPTWNYVAVHVRGQIRALTDPDEVFGTMEILVKTNEDTYGTGWVLKRNKSLELLAKGIVAFEITNLTFEAKLKLSQKLDRADRENVIGKLEAVGQAPLADWMKLTRPK